MAAFLDGRDAFFQARYGEALRTLAGVIQMENRFLWGFLAQAECFRILCG